MILGHDTVMAWLKRAVDNNCLPGALLFEGALGVGKATVARSTVARLVQDEGQSLDETERAVARGLHPDCMIVRPLEDNRWVTVDGVQKMVDFTQRSAVMGACKYIIVDALDGVHHTARDSMLKCLEEANNVYFFLIAHSPKAVTVTIRSRSHALRFHTLSHQDFDCVVERECTEKEYGASLYVLTNGSPGLACTLLEQEGVLSAAEEFFSLMHGVIARTPGHEQKLAYASEQRQFLDYVLLMRLCENVAAFSTIQPNTQRFLGKNWQEFPHFFMKMRGLLHDSVLYHTSWKSFLWCLYSLANDG